MGKCTRHILITTCIIQLVTTFERQLFDFLGFMWAPILINFFQIIFVIFGLFGAFQYQCKYVLSHWIWNLVSLSWNIFVILFYLDVGGLDKNSDILNLGTGSVSWWEANGYGCKPYYSPNMTNDDFYRPQRPDFVNGCFLEYTTVEIVHAAIQAALSTVGLLTSPWFIRIICRDIKAGTSSLKRKPNKKPSLYSIEFSSDHHNQNGNDSDTLDSDINMSMGYLQNSKPMTPRRVKRRSVMTRGHPHHSSTMRRQHGTLRHSGNGTLRSVRESQRRSNPVTQIIDHQMRDSTWQRNGHSNPSYQQSSIQSLNEQSDYDVCNRPPSARSTYSNFHGMRHMSSPSSVSQQSFNQNPTPQAPMKRDRQRQSLRSMAFLNSGPPAYTLQGSNQLDSETTI